MVLRLTKKMRETFFLNYLKTTIWLTIIACIFSYLFIDLPLAEYFKDQSGPIKRAAKIISNTISFQTQCYVWATLFFLLRFVRKVEPYYNRCLLVILSMSISGLFTGVFKFILGRPRPKLLFTENLHELTFFQIAFNETSFPSGHASVIGAVCGTFACFYPKKTPLFLSFALAMAFSRVILTAHFLSDIIAGTMIGIIVSQWIYTLMRKEHIPLTRR